jgi:hypothetical protein
MDEHGPFIDDLPIKAGDFPVRYASLPEGKMCQLSTRSAIICGILVDSKNRPSR